MKQFSSGVDLQLAQRFIEFRIYRSIALCEEDLLQEKFEAPTIVAKRRWLTSDLLHG